MKSLGSWPWPLLLILGLLGPWHGSAFGQDQEPRVSDGCNRCDHRGVIPCKRHDEADLAREATVDFCAIAARCQDCGGSFVVDCPYCIGGPDSAAAEQRRARLQGILAAGIQAEKLLDRPLPWLRTPHFTLVVDVKSLKDGSKRLSAHDFLHRFATEAEAAADQLDQHLDAKPSHYVRPTIYYWESLEDHRRVNRELLGTNTDSAMKLYGAKPAASSWVNAKGLGGKALPVAANGVHIGIHLLLSCVFRAEWIGNKKAGWFDVGAAHWYEEQRFRRTATYCVDEANADLDYKNGQWRSVVKSRLAKEKDRLLPELCRKLSGTLWEDEHALAWSLYDWLVTVHPEQTADFLLGFKDGKEMREICREQLDMSLFEVEDAWRRWVAESYPSKNPKARKKL